MFKGLRYIPETTRIDFIRWRFFAFAVSTLVILGTFVLLGTKGLNYGIDFTGGTVMEIQTEEVPDLADLRGTLSALELGDISIQSFGSPNDYLIRFPSQGERQADQDAATARVQGALEDRLGAGVEVRRIEFVGPQVGRELKQKGLYAVLFSIIGILGYVWLRFEWQFGLAAVAALVHDVIGTIGFYVLIGKTFDLTTLAALLMVAGYSTNDTVVIFDRMREVMQKYKKKPLKEICNIALNQTLSRTIATGLTTLLALLALFLFGGEVIRGFVDALIFGVIIGTFSSVYIASATLLYLGLRPEKATDKAAETATTP